MKDSYSNKIEEVMNSAMRNIRTLVDVDVVVGKQIQGSTGVMVFPLTKVTMGFVSGGGEYYSELKEIKKETEYPFAGGSGAGFSLQPIGFLVIDGVGVNVVKVDQTSALEKLIEVVPEITKFLAKAMKYKNDDKKD